MKNQGIRIFHILSVVLLLVMLGAGKAYSQLFPIADGTTGTPTVSGAANTAMPSATNKPKVVGLAETFSLR